MQVTLIIPRDVQKALLNLPILAFRVGKNFESFYGWCKTCCLEKNMTKDCNHYGDSRAFTDSYDLVFILHIIISIKSNKTFLFLQYELNYALVRFI